MEQVFVSVVIAITTALAYLITRRFAAVNGQSFRRALETVLECIGTCILFIGLNVALGVMLVFLIRGFTPWFIAPYVVSDLMLVVLSVVQGFVFQTWWRSARRA